MTAAKVPHRAAPNDPDNDFFSVILGPPTRMPIIDAAGSQILTFKILKIMISLDSVRKLTAITPAKKNKAAGGLSHFS